MSRPVFVLGTGRCGSTLLHEILARHELTGFVTNLDDRGLVRSSRRHNELWRRLPSGVTEKGRVRFAPSEGYRVISREVSPLVVDPFRDLTAADATPWLRERLERFVEDRASSVGSPVFLHKFTGWPRHGLLDAVFPDATYVHVVRDGRAVANSWLQMPWWRGHLGPSQWHFGPLPAHLQQIWEEYDRSFVVLAGLAWRLLVDAYTAAEVTARPGSWLNIRYEDLVSDPRHALEQVLDHLDLPWTSSFEHALGRYRVGPQRTDSYRRDLAAEDVRSLDTVLNEGLARYGYH